MQKKGYSNYVIWKKSRNFFKTSPRQHVNITSIQNHIQVSDSFSALENLLHDLRFNENNLALGYKSDTYTAHIYENLKHKVNLDKFLDLNKNNSFMDIEINLERSAFIKVILNTVKFVISHTGSINIFSPSPFLIDENLNYILGKCQESKWYGRYTSLS